MRELTLKVGKIDYSTGNPLSKRKVRTRISAVYLYQTPPPPPPSAINRPPHSTYDYFIRWVRITNTPI